MALSCNKFEVAYVSTCHAPHRGMRFTSFTTHVFFTATATWKIFYHSTVFASMLILITSHMSIVGGG